MSKLKCIKPALKVANTATAAIPPKQADPYYSSGEWRGLRKAALERDGFACAAPGCTRRAHTIDHIVSRKVGGKDELANLRSLCASHNAQVKEDPSGNRRNGGVLGAFKRPREP
jgi:5-methylcytosine-specific restriction endonuclease McrA